MKWFTFIMQIREFVGEKMSFRGIEFHTEESPRAILKSSDGSLSLETNKGIVDGFSQVVFIIGRQPNTKVRIFLLSLAHCLQKFPNCSLVQFLHFRWNTGAHVLVDNSSKLLIHSYL